VKHTSFSQNIFSFFIEKNHSKICVIQKIVVPLQKKKEKETLTN